MYVKYMEKILNKNYHSSKKAKIQLNECFNQKLLVKRLWHYNLKFKEIYNKDLQEIILNKIYFLKKRNNKFNHKFSK